MRSAPAIRPHRGEALALAALYALVMAYSSTVIGPEGLHFVPMAPAAALRLFMKIRFVANGSDQRADWIGNLLMLVPYGFLCCAALHPPVSRAMMRRIAAYACAFAIGFATVLIIKYVQLFFPPRTVTLNYVAAQGTGLVLGCLVFAVWRRALPMLERWQSGSGLALVLRVYVAGLLVFLLMPLDFALNTHDLMAQMARLPDTVTSIPGSTRPPAVQAMVLIGGTLAFLPVGVWLSLLHDGVWRVGHTLPSVLARGTALTVGVFALSTLVMGAYPSLVAILYRLGGIAAGAILAQRLVRQDPRRLRYRMGRLVPLLALPYLFALIAANRLLSLQWQSPAEALDHLYTLGLIPLFDYYIVSKADAAKNIVGHLIMYLPIGVALWLRRPWARNGIQAAIIAAVLATIMEVGRYLRPGLEGDINAIAVGAFGAWLAATAMPAIWLMLESLVRHSNRPRRVLGGSPERPAAMAEVEDY